LELSAHCTWRKAENLLDRGKVGLAGFIERLDRAEMWNESFEATKVGLEMLPSVEVAVLRLRKL